MSKRLLTNNKGRLFKARYRKTSKDARAYIQPGNNNFLKLSNFENTNLESTSSFRYEYNKPIKSTQQLNLDFSKFENHTFFHSAVAKVNESFLNILNFYPYNGTEIEIEAFEDGLTGFEKYVLDKYPKNKGYLVFSGTQKGESLLNGTQINVLDQNATRIPTIKSLKDKNVTLDPTVNNFSIQFFVNPESIGNDNQIIVQKKSSLANNFTLFLSNSASTSNCELHFGITSGSRYTAVSASIDKGSFSHVTAMFDTEFDQKAKLVIFDQDDIKTVASSSNALNVLSLKYLGADLNIGSGANFRYQDETFEPQETFSGSIDDFRLYHRKLTDKEIFKNKDRSVSGDKNLVLYYKFNEPYGDYTGNNIVLDHSVNSRSELINNFNINNRLTASFTPLKSEDINRSPVLFPKFPTVAAFNSQMLVTASLYDTANPNLITKLIPQHYLDTGNNFEGYENHLGKIQNEISDLQTLRESVNTQRSAQMMTKFLLIWAKHFDEIKMFIDSFSLYRIIDYDDLDTAPDTFLKKLSDHLGMPVPELFTQNSADGFFKGLDLQNTASKSNLSIKKIQYTIWRRILSEYSSYVSSKGTLDSVKKTFLAAGIDPSNIFHIREYGGSKARSLKSSVQKINDNIGFINFSGSIGNELNSKDSQGRSINDSPYIKSTFLSASRVSPGKPLTRGTFVNGISNNSSDGLFTSASFDYHATYFYPQHLSHKNEQSLVRMHSTGSTVPSTKESCSINLVNFNQQKKLSLFIADDPSSSTISELFLTGINIADGNIWSVNFGRKNSEFFESDAVSEFYLKASTFEPGLDPILHKTSSLLAETSTSIFSNTSIAHNVSGSFLTIGSQSFEDTSLFINAGNDDQKTTHFSGHISFINFWSKDYTDREFTAYVKNPSSYASNNVKSNYNFFQVQSGSNQKVRIHTSGKQATTASNANGELRIFDFSQEENHFSGYNFESNKRVIANKNFIREVLSPNFDLNASENKIRIRSLQSEDLLENHDFATIAPVFEVDPAEEVIDDSRLSFDLSVMKGLNENIVDVFPHFDEIENALGKPNLIFNERYPDLENLRKVYFENVIEDLNLSKYKELFKWLDSSFTEIIFESIPRNTKFLGVNFIYESHMLERNKLKYLHDEIYLKSLPRDPSRGNIFLSQFVCKVKKG